MPSLKLVYIIDLFLFGSKHLVKMQQTVSNIKENKIGFYSGN